MVMCFVLTWTVNYTIELCTVKAELIASAKGIDSDLPARSSQVDLFD